jgi:hypothetical protein
MRWKGGLVILLVTLLAIPYEGFPTLNQAEICEVDQN